MKKILFLLCILGFVILAGCAKDKGIGIIGGADGPTQIYVTDN